MRLRKPKTAWLWQSKEERQALDGLSERLTTGMEGGDLFKAVLPPCWWDLAMKCTQQQEQLAVATKLADSPREKPVFPQRVLPDTVFVTDKPSREHPVYPKAGQSARFVLGWICGAMATAFTVLWLPPEEIYRVLTTFRASGSHSPALSDVGAASLSPDKVTKTPAEMETWRNEHLQRMASEMTQFASQQAVAKSSGWRDNELVLSGHSQELPHESTRT